MISTTLSSIATNISAAYDQIGTMGGSIPLSKNLENLPSAIGTIPSAQLMTDRNASYFAYTAESPDKALTHIPAGAFDGCVNLSQVWLDVTFSQVYGYESISGGGTLSTNQYFLPIFKNAFANCPNLHDIVINVVDPPSKILSWPQVAGTLFKDITVNTSERDHANNIYLGQMSISTYTNYASNGLSSIAVRRLVNANLFGESTVFGFSQSGWGAYWNWVSWSTASPNCIYSQAPTIWITWTEAMKNYGQSVGASTIGPSTATRLIDMYSTMSSWLKTKLNMDEYNPYGKVELLYTYSTFSTASTYSYLNPWPSYISIPSIYSSLA